MPTDVLAHDQRRAGAVERGGGVHGAGRVEELLLDADAIGHRRQHLERRSATVPVSGSSRSASSSSDVDPQSPHDDDIVPSRGVGAGARPPVSTETTLNSVSTAEPVAQ